MKEPKELKELIIEDIAVFKKICYKVENILSLNENGKFIISQEKIKGVGDMAKYFLGKRIQEINASETQEDTVQENDNN